jgi:sugar phosphate isomerase/epimerase
VLWDVHHPYRTVNENPIKTWETLGEWIEYTHWKDSYIKEDHDNGFQYCLMGNGDIPLDNIYHIFKDNKYDGWYTLEWEKKWHPEIEEPEVAFPQYVQYMRSLTKQEV